MAMWHYLNYYCCIPPQNQHSQKHLTDTQLQDYLKFNRARQQRNLQATARQIVVLLDRELSLTADQRRSVEQLLLDTTESESFPTAMSR